MGLLKLTESERLEILNLHNNARIIKEQVTPAVPAAGTSAPAAAAPATVEDVIKQIQTTLNTKYGTKLTVDGKWGNLTQTAFETAAKSKATPAAAPTTGTPAAAPTTGTPAAAPTTRTPATAVAAAPKAPLPSVMAPTVPGVSYQTTPTTQVPATQAPATQAPVVDAGSTDFTDGGEQAPAQSNRDQRRERQDLRRGNRRAMQDLRAGQRGQQQ
jgi:hypothetical protein